MVKKEHIVKYPATHCLLDTMQDLFDFREMGDLRPCHVLIYYAKYKGYIGFGKDHVNQLIMQSFRSMYSSQLVHLLCCDSLYSLRLKILRVCLAYAFQVMSILFSTKIIFVLRYMVLFPYDSSNKVGYPTTKHLRCKEKFSTRKS